VTNDRYVEDDAAVPTVDPPCPPPPAPPGRGRGVLADGRDRRQVRRGRRRGPHRRPAVSAAARATAARRRSAAPLARRHAADQALIARHRHVQRGQGAQRLAHDAAVLAQAVPQRAPGLVVLAAPDVVLAHAQQRRRQLRPRLLERRLVPPQRGQQGSVVLSRGPGALGALGAATAPAAGRAEAGDAPSDAPADAPADACDGGRRGEMLRRGARYDENMLFMVNTRGRLLRSVRGRPGEVRPGHGGTARHCYCIFVFFSIVLYLSGGP
jgi:hypothetical protein